MNCEKLFFYKESTFNNEKSLSNFIYVIVDISGLLLKSEIKQKLKLFITNQERWSKIITENFLDLYWKTCKINYKNHLIFKKYINFDKHKFMNKILNKGLKKDRPMWKLYMINDEKNTHLIFKCHHIYGDGYYLMKEVFIKYFIDKPIQTSNKILKEKYKKNINNTCKKNCKKNCNKKFLNILNGVYYCKKYIFKLFLIILIPIFFLFFGFCLFIYSLNNLINNFNFEKIFEKKKNNKMKSVHLYELDVSRCKKLKNKYNISMNTLIHFIIFKTIQNYKLNYDKKYDKKNIKIQYISIFSKNFSRNNNYINTIPFMETIIFDNVNNKKNINELHRVLSNYKLFINTLTGYSHFSSIINNLINKFTQKKLNYIYNSNIKNFNVAISNFHSFLSLNKINNREILNIHNFVVMHEIKLLFTCCSYNNIINLNIVYQNNILNYKNLRNSLKNILLELSY